MIGMAPRYGLCRYDLVGACSAKEAPIKRVDLNRRHQPKARNLPLNILYISDSLGTPIHPRGIFNYSVSFVEMLKSLGAEVTLVVEREAGYGFSGKFSKQFTDVGATAIAGAHTGEVYRYFAESNFSFNWRYQLPWFRFLAEHAAPVARLVQRVEELATRHHHQRIIENEYRLMDYIPEKAAHLNKFDRFAYLDRFYYSSLLRAANGMDPIEIDATGYDAAIIDTPTYVRLAGLPSSRIFAVVHDLIPLSDPAMGAEWRRVFAKKLEAIFALNPHIIFVSETTQANLSKLFPRFTPRSQSVIYPTIRQELAAAATTTRASGRGAELAAAAHARGPKPAAGKVPDTDEVKAARPALAIPWNPSLPYFATALSDERRKNVSLILDAFARLSGTANMAIVGQINPDRYFDPAISLPSNVCVMGYLSEADKTDVIQASAGVIFPSLSEGFGIPIVEGAVLGVPVLCSDIPVFREVAGPSALYFDPMDAGSLVAAVTQAIAEPDAQRARAADLQTSVLQRFSQAAMSQRVAATLAKAGLRLEVAPTEPVDAGPSRGPVSIAS